MRKSLYRTCERYCPALNQLTEVILHVGVLLENQPLESKQIFFCERYNLLCVWGELGTLSVTQAVPSDCN